MPIAAIAASGASRIAASGVLGLTPPLPADGGRCSVDRRRGLGGFEGGRERPAARQSWAAAKPISKLGPRVDRRFTKKARAVFESAIPAIGAFPAGVREAPAELRTWSSDTVRMLRYAEKWSWMLQSWWSNGRFNGGMMLRSPWRRCQIHAYNAGRL